MSEQATEHGLTASEYIKHHLHHLQSGHQQSQVDFSVVNLDTVFWAWFAGLLALFMLWKATRKATTGVPGRLQCAIEMLVEMVDEQAKSIVHGDRSFIAPLALTIFVWIIFMNSLDLFPVDWFPWIAHNVFHFEYMRVVPTADINATLGMSFAVFLLTLYYGIKVKGIGGFSHELIAAPFGDKWFLAPINLAMQLIEYAAKTLSLGLRLYGNMYAGELLFMLIALLGAIAFPWEGGAGFGSFMGSAVAQMAWAIFHILIVVLQAYIFMMLSLVYLGQAHDAH
ncbi:F0F1 ATP synthase subunit A [Permianibacter fluminis]|uniref:F0F1 ATP synthase subunit A n=1 Tax=Permianibacter fluminis TaxID=2738515 RepID=UPI001B7D839E|nr:F0F1 ATP synthase subunit A [Permianibacter fluminis]